MHSRLTFLHLRTDAITDGATEKGSRTGFWTSPRWHVGWAVVKRAARDG